MDAGAQDPPSSALPLAWTQEGTLTSHTPSQELPEPAQQGHEASVSLAAEILHKGKEDEGQGFDFILNPDLDPVDDDESSEEFSDDEW